MRQNFLLTTFLILASCAGTSEVVTTGTDTADSGTVADQSANLDTTAPEDSATPADLFTDDLGAEELFFPDVPDALSPGCLPGEGCFLDKCATNEECLSGWCVEHLGEGVCSQSCQAECPPGWECQQVAGTVPDVVYICVSTHANLCRPCASGTECKSVGGAEDVCVDYNEAGSFCGGVCTTDEDCPWGFSCLTTDTVDGIGTLQCVADAGECPCTGKSVALSLWTPCETGNEFGLCEGKRVCTEEGLLECDALIPAADVCNGLDDNCDGEVDETTCDDSNDCTEDTCLGEEGCQNVALDQGECKDNNPCTVADHCEAGDCVGDPVLCDDKNPCTEDLCTEQGGCEHPFVFGPCDDGDPCTVGDQCGDGACEGTPLACDCSENAECAALEDGDLCNGTLVCDIEALPMKCIIDIATVVSCPEPDGLDAPCLAPSCDPMSGVCSVVPAHDGAPCDDGDLCTLGDTCSNGTCDPGPATNCNDGNTCTDDSCAGEVGCVHQDSQAPCTDGDVCTLGDLCDGGECLSGDPLECDDENLCTDDSCDGAIGCLHENNLAACDDGNACTKDDLCSGGSCSAGDDVICNDDNPCTAETCSPANGCIYQMLTTACDDGDACTGPDLCQQGDCSGAQLVCDDDNPCTDDACLPGQGCVFTDNAADCDDGNACTDGDVCAKGTCEGGELLDCNDENLCTSETCSPKDGCVYTFNTAPCTDNDVCTLNDQCSLGECATSGSLSCADLNPCTDDSCDPNVGCSFVPNQAPCSDGNACTAADVCDSGSCGAGDDLDCDDQNPCTDDACDSQTGCVHVNNVLPCDDDDACTLADTCATGACVGGPDLDCDDQNLCTNDDCDAEDGCVYQFNVEPCNDNDPCTVTDACDGGSCSGAGDLDCDDNVVCTTDSCETGVGCKHVPTVDYETDENNCGDCGVVCDQGKKCTGGECKTLNPWAGAGAQWESAGKSFGRFTWAQANVSNNGRSNATSYCTGKGGTLARPNSQDEWDKLFQNLPNDSHGYWIDGHNNYSCGSATPGNPKAYQYGMMYCPAGTSKLYTGCNCTQSEQGIVVYRYTGGGPFDGCQSHAGTGNLGAMDESLSYGHGGIHGFVCEG